MLLQRKQDHPRIADRGLQRILEIHVAKFERCKHGLGLENPSIALAIIARMLVIFLFKCVKKIIELL